MSTRLYSRNAVLLAKIETTEGSDSGPTGTANAVLVSDLSVEPLAGGELDLSYIRPYFGISPSIRTENYLTAQFTVDFAGTATAGTAPPWGPLARGCAFAETLTANNITGTAQAGASTSITLAAGASATDNLYVGMTVSFTLPGPISSSGPRTIIAYNGTTKIATINKAWDGDPPTSSDTYTITKNAIYTPVSSGFESLTLYYNLNGVRHKMLGCKGSLTITQTARERPALRFSFTGVDGGVADASEATPVYTAWQTPQTINTANTTAMIGGKQATGSATGVQLMSFSLDMANTVAYRQLVGAESVILTDRQPRGAVSIEATTVTFKDWWTEIKASTKAALLIENGTVAGNVTGIFLPQAQLAEPKYGDSDGIAMLEMSVRALPLVGNDEVRLVVK
jgi:hypothetical protein